MKTDNLKKIIDIFNGIKEGFVYIKKLDQGNLVLSYNQTTISNVFIFEELPEVCIPYYNLEFLKVLYKNHRKEGSVPIAEFMEYTIEASEPPNDVFGLMRDANQNKTLAEITIFPKDLETICKRMGNDKTVKLTIKADHAIFAYNESGDVSMMKYIK